MMKKLLLLLVVLMLGSASLLRARTVLYSFEGELDGWTTIDADGDGYNWDLSSIINSIYAIPAVAHDGVDGLASESFSDDGGELTPDNFIVSPLGQYTKITFWACAMDEIYCAEHFGVAVSTTGNTSAADFTLLNEWTIANEKRGGNHQIRAGRETTEWIKYTVDLSAYEGQDIYVAIRHFDCEGQFMLNVDEVKLTLPDNSIVIDFETGDFSQYEFTNNSTYPWIVVEEGGNHYAKSGNGGVASSSSELSATHVFAEAGYIAFDFNCMGEGTSTLWDHCDFFIDGALQFQHGADHQGWDFGLWNVTAGSHTFKWSYTKDGSVDPSGDFFAIDNIVFGEGDPCVAPASISATAQSGGAVITWGGNAATFTLGYKPVSGTTWTEIGGITANTYSLTGLTPGMYDMRVQADCDEENYATGTFMVMAGPQSTANWYGYNTYGTTNQEQIVEFSVQNLNNVTVANMSSVIKGYATAYAGSYVWHIANSDNGGSLYKAQFDNEAHSIGNFIEVVSGFNSGATATSMAYNPVDGMMYFVDASTYTIKKFDPANPSAGATTVGSEADMHLYAFAINAEGVGYGIRNTGDLYTVDLTNGAQTLVGSTGVECAYVQSMAFDHQTGELFWAQILDGSTYGFYKVDPTTGAALNLGTVSGVCELTGMFSAYGSTVGSIITDVMLEGFVAPQYNGHPNFSVTVPASAHYSVQSVNWYNGNTAMTSSDVFNDESANYHMVVNLTPESGFEFGNNVTAYFNGDNTIAASCTVSGGVLHVQTIDFNVVDAIVYDFEDSTMQGWTTIDADGDGYTWVLGSVAMDYGYGHNGSQDMVLSQSYINSAGPLTPDNYLVSPAKAAYNHISFYACAQDAAYASEHFGVAVSLNGNTSGSDFVTIDEWTMTSKGIGAKSIGRGGETRAQGNWYEITADLSAYAGQEFWLAIRHFNCTDWFYLDVDDISLAIGETNVYENEANVLSIYPNPAKDRVMVTSEVVVNEYRVYDVTGAEVMSNMVNSDTFEVNVDNLSAGVYYLRIYSDGLVQSKKFIVE